MLLSELMFYGRCPGVGGDVGLVVSEEFTVNLVECLKTSSLHSTS